MSKATHLTIVANNFDYIFEPIEPTLAPQGVTIRRFRTTQALRLDQAAMAETEVLFVVGSPCSRDLMQAMPKLRAVLSPITGTDAIDETAATELGILVGNGQTPENTESMAESTILLILAALYDLRHAESLLRENQPEPLPPHGTMLRGKRIGLIGFGGIAQAIVERLQPWKVRFQTYMPRQHGPLPDGVERVELDALLQTSDIITLLTPLTPETRGMIDARRLGLIRQGAILVNTSRGGIIDEAALYDLAQAGRFRAIALDVFATEPLPEDSKLRDLQNAILTPHMIGHTTEALQAFIETALENAVRVLDGRAPLYVRNKQILAAWEQRFGAE
jgi:phosphoglycerate dehydrogenase-like enzyme